MASEDGRCGGEEDKHEGGPSDLKPGQMDLIAAMLAGMRQEMAVDREAHTQRAREQTQRTDELAREQAQRTDELAREQAQRADELARRSDEQVRHFVEDLQSSLTSLKAETRQYTDEACGSVRSELLDKVQTLEGEVQGLREEVKIEKQRRELATARGEEQAAARVLAGSAGMADLLGPAWGPWQEPMAAGPRSAVSEPVAVAGGWGTIVTPPLSPAGGRPVLAHPAPLPPSPALSPCRPASCPHEARSPPLSPSASRHSVRRKPAKYDGKVAGRLTWPSLRCWPLPRAGARTRRLYSCPQRCGAMR